jgi:hypothetical protein
MEKFEGNGAECMVRFIADGCKGVIYDKTTEPIMTREEWNAIGDTHTWKLDWLAAPCTYYPPEPVWIGITCERY